MPKIVFIILIIIFSNCYCAQLSTDLRQLSKSLTQLHKKLRPVTEQEERMAKLAHEMKQMIDCSFALCTHSAQDVEKFITLLAEFEVLAVQVLSVDKAQQAILVQKLPFLAWSLFCIGSQQFEKRVFKEEVLREYLALNAEYQEAINAAGDFGKNFVRKHKAQDECFLRWAQIADEQLNKVTVSQKLQNEQKEKLGSGFGKVSFEEIERRRNALKKVSEEEKKRTKEKSEFEKRLEKIRKAVASEIEEQQEEAAAPDEKEDWED